MKKRLSGLGILFILIVKNPPVPHFSLFAKESITEVRGYSLKQVALQFSLN
jgi:hypothetical protein